MLCGPASQKLCFSSPVLGTMSSLRSVPRTLDRFLTVKISKIFASLLLSQPLPRFDSLICSLGRAGLWRQWGVVGRHLRRKGFFQQSCFLPPGCHRICSQVKNSLIKWRKRDFLLTREARLGLGTVVILIHLHQPWCFHPSHQLLDLYQPSTGSDSFVVVVTHLLLCKQY